MSDSVGGTPLEAATAAVRVVFNDEATGFVSATWAEATARAALTAAIDALTEEAWQPQCSRV